MPAVVDILERAPEHLEAPLACDGAAPLDIVDEWGAQSFPASDPPANW